MTDCDREALSTDRHDDGCRSCGSPSATAWDTVDGRVRLCPPCAALHGVGCP